MKDKRDTIRENENSVLNTTENEDKDEKTRANVFDAAMFWMRMPIGEG